MDDELSEIEMELWKYWKELLTFIRNTDISYIWESKKELNGIKTEAERILYFLKKHNEFYANKQAYIDEFSRTRKLISDLDRIEPSKQFLKLLHDDIAEVFGGLHELEAERMQIEDPGRRRLLGLIPRIAAGVALGVALTPKEALAQGLRDKALLYDIFISSFGVQRDVSSDRRRVNAEQQRVFDSLSPRWKPFLKIESTRVRHQFYLEVNTIAEHADLISAEVNKTGAAKRAYKTLRPYFFDINSDRGRYAYIFSEGSVGDTVKVYTTRYGSDVQPTVDYLISLYGRIPGRGEFIKIPVRFLKTPYRTGLRLDKDYAQTTLKEGGSLWSVASNYTEGDFMENYSIIAKFNDIRPGQEKVLAPGTMIMIPYEIYKNPLNPTIVAESLGRAKIIRESPPIITKPEEPPETKEDIKERTETITKVVPELGNVNDFLDNVRRQSLGVMRVEMPSVLSESFNVRNNQQHDFYSNSRNLRGLAESYGRGILNYLARNPSITKVITDNGHGERDPGAPGKDGRSETDFTKGIQKELEIFLKREGPKIRPGFRVFSLNYMGPPSPVARLRYYVTEANKLGNSSDSVYISIHIDSMNASATPPPRIFVLNRGSQPKSSMLGAFMLSQAIPFYERTFR